MIEHLHVELLSDATFSGGAPSGQVDIDVAHDDLGLPMIPGTTLKRLLAGSWRTMEPRFDRSMRRAADSVFGLGAELARTGILDCGDATVDPEAERWIRAAQHGGSLDPTETLELMTAIRTQTAVDSETGAPALGSLRTRRVVLAGLQLTCEAEWLRRPTEDQRRVLALAALATRHGGLARNRGAGHIRVTLSGDLGLTRRLAGVVA